MSIVKLKLIIGNIASKRVLKIINAVCKEIIRRINCIYYYKYYTVILGQDFYQDARSKQKLVEIDEGEWLLFNLREKYNTFDKISFENRQ